MDLLLAELPAPAGGPRPDPGADARPRGALIGDARDTIPQFGARPLKRAVQRLVENPLARALLEGRFPPGSHIVGRRRPGLGTLLFSAGDTILVADATERRDAHSAARSEPRDPLEAAIEEATAPAGKKRDSDLLN